jgi:hypothetical protein
MLEQCWAHQAIVREVFEAVTPSTLVHGHFHTGYELDVDEAWGPVHVIGLDHGNKESWGKILTAKNGEIDISDWVTAIKRRRPASSPLDETHSDETIS